MSQSVAFFKAFAPLVDFVYPPRCPLCGDGLAAQDGLCLACWETLAFPSAGACPACQLPREPDEGCRTCAAHPPLHDGMTAGTLYNATSRQLVLSFKHGRKLALAPMLARLIAARLPALEGEWLAIPVPLHRMRLWQRGFNQSALLARELARLRDLTLVVDGLERRKATASLGGLGRAERARVLDGSIAISRRHAARIAGANVLLVDDVLTSGATTNACVQALKHAGAARVRIGCFARVDEARA